MTRPSTELLIVYNADSGPFSALADALHKVISPSTYPCSLCAVTYGPVAMRSKWRDFLATLPLQKRFYHRDDFAAAYPEARIALPAILVLEAARLPEVLITAAELNETPDLERLVGLVRQKLDTTSASA